MIASELPLCGQRVFYIHEYDSYKNSDKTLFPKGTKLDSAEIVVKSQTSIQQYRLKGYALAAVDSFDFKGDTCKIWWYSGAKYEFGLITMNDDTRELLNLAGLNKYNWNAKNLDSNAVSSFLIDVVNYLVNNGFPFAKAYFKDIVFDKNKVNLRLELDKGRYITYDTLEITGNLRLSKNYLQRYLRLMPGNSYRHADVQNSTKLLRNLPFAQSKSEPTVSFVNDVAIVNLKLDANNASRFDFIIGILPGTSSIGGRGFLLTGEILADLQNKFGVGERINVFFRRLEFEDQEIKLGFSYPYLFNTAFGADFSFELRRNRGLSVDINTVLGGQYIIDGNSLIKIFWNLRSGRLTKIDTARLVQTMRLPPNLDYNYSGGGLELVRQNYDYKFNPSRGWELNLNLGAGVRSIIKNNEILSINAENVDFTALYDSINLNTLQLNVVLSGTLFMPISNRITLKNNIQGGVRFDQGKALENEIFRIGGHRLLRGFDELSIFTNLYAIYTAELRLLIDRNSYLSLPFIDIARMRVLAEGQTLWDNALGVGMGINFATQIGIFNISFAAGKRLDNPINFQDTKVHFGYVSLF